MTQAIRKFAVPLKKWGLREYVLLALFWAGLALPLYFVGWGWASVLSLPLFLLTVFGITWLLTKAVTAQKVSWGGDNIKLVVSENGVTYTDFHNRTEAVAWDEIREIWWEPNAPEYGFSHWVVFGNKKSVEIDERSADKEKLPGLLSEKLPGFDRNIVKVATETGYFESDQYRTLICWSKK